MVYELVIPGEGVSAFLCSAYKMSLTIVRLLMPCQIILMFVRTGAVLAAWEVAEEAWYNSELGLRSI